MASDIPTADPMQLYVRLLLEQAEMYIEQGEGGSERGEGVLWVGG